MLQLVGAGKHPDDEETGVGIFIIIIVIITLAIAAVRIRPGSRSGSVSVFGVRVSAFRLLLSWSLQYRFRDQGWRCFGPQIGLQMLV